MTDQTSRPARPTRITGRISAAPSAVVDTLVLGPQFEHELTNLFPHYLAIEVALVAEYRRLGVMEESDAYAIRQTLLSLSVDDVRADRNANFTDILFAIEQAVTARIAVPAGWHVDRSRNDCQATAQRMYVRDLLLDLVGQVTAFCGQLIDKAEAHLTDPMPGQTHLQAAQVITPAFWLTSWVEELLHALAGLAVDYLRLDCCPLGSGAMSGQYLAWNRQILARSLGFTKSERHALVSVASRGWVLQLLGSLSEVAIVTSRFVTDLMMWGSGAYQFVQFSDELAGISSAMPQKRNYPVLERIRGRTAHVTSGYIDVALGQRNTTYTNLVEVSKEASAMLPTTLSVAADTFTLLATAIDAIVFDRERMRCAAADEYLGGFALANALTLTAELPWRTAQVAAGEFITEAIASGQRPDSVAATLLVRVVERHGLAIGVDQAQSLLDTTFALDGALCSMSSNGSTAPDSVRSIINAQRLELAEIAAQWQQHRVRVSEASGLR